MISKQAGNLFFFSQKMNFPGNYHLINLNAANLLVQSVICKCIISMKQLFIVNVYQLNIHIIHQLIDYANKLVEY